MAERTTKTKQIKEYLLDNKKITPLVAFEKFHAQRLASIIFNLRRRGMNISTRTIVDKDCNGNTMQYAEYVYIGE